MTETAFEDLTPPSLNDLPDSEAPASPEASAPKPKKQKKAKVAKPEPVEGEAAEAAAPAPRKSKLSALYPEDAEITVLVEGNPKKAGSRAAEVFGFYRTSKTVGDFFAATAHIVTTNKEGEIKKRPGDMGDITYDVGHGYIKVG
jgi:hypothetical protein